MKIRFSVVVLVGAIVGIALFWVHEGVEEEPGKAPLVSLENIQYQVVVENLEIPWDIAFLPNGDLLVSERPGRLIKISRKGEMVSIPLRDVEHEGEGGLLGVTLHPNFKENNLVYLYMSTPGEDGETANTVVRYRLFDDELLEKKIIITGIPGAIYHDGGRIEFGPPTSCESGQADCYLYITTGDATREKLAQDKNSLAGKILRVTEDGGIPKDNPFGTALYSYGHRNPQGLAWDSEGWLWETEHGRSGVLSGFDELNLIKPGNNYGWPEIEGGKEATGMMPAVLHSGSDITWAPASLAYLNGSLYWGGLRGESLYKATIAGDEVTNLKAYFVNELGRIRTVRVGSDGFLYLTTSNRDGRGSAQTGDDKIIKVDPRLLR